MSPRAYRILPLSTALVDETRVLARIRFGSEVRANQGPREVSVPLPVLAGEPDELWLSTNAVLTGHQEGAGFAENGAVLFGQLHLREPELAAQGIHRAVCEAYSRIERLLATRGYPHWLRTWNYLANILEGIGDAQRYRQFNLGRHEALSRNAGFESRLPAATVIGTRGDGFVIYFLAGREPGRPVENPRQMNAWRYPPQHGPRSPSFSRAMWLNWAEGAELLVSGTASVVGHESRHPHRVTDQLTETLTNLDSLRAEAERLNGLPLQALQPQGFKIYVADRACWPELKELLPKRWSDLPLSVFEGTICRDDLQVEIEGNYLAKKKP